ncbi:MAG: class I SAM-dependent methyltransferase [Nostoc sp.]|uniref:class I SAM-dependent methyltransferase n=1 Tax=Nostoc sp. TaxID=1180 RepID=UPI002FF1214E
MQTIEFYDQDYYKSHYGFLLNDKDYYQILSTYWKYVIFDQLGFSPELSTLDYGCGLGQVTSALKNVNFFDPSEFAVDFLRHQGKNATSNRKSIPVEYFDYLVSSHSLEHSPEPANNLKEFHQYLKADGKLFLILPVETNFNPSLQPDSDQHFQCWTFQTITNLLFHCGWRPIHQSYLYNPFLLRTMASKITNSQLIKLSALFGKYKRSYPSLLTVAERITTY